MIRVNKNQWVDIEKVFIINLTGGSNWLILDNGKPVSIEKEYLESVKVVFLGREE